MASRLIERFDIDKDGKVALDELTNRQSKVFALMDRDDSGAITAEELPQRVAMRGDGQQRGWNRKDMKGQRQGERGGQYGQRGPGGANFFWGPL